MNQDETWHGGRPRSRLHCVRTQPPPKRGHCPQFSAHVCCGQTTGWIVTPFGTAVDLSLGEIVHNPVIL